VVAEEEVAAVGLKKERESKATTEVVVVGIQAASVARIVMVPLMLTTTMARRKRV